MAIDITKTLRKALKELQAEREKIDDQIAVIQRVLGAEKGRAVRGGKRPAKARQRRRKPMSAAQRKAVSRRMKAYWAKRKAESRKGKGVAEK